MKKSAIVAAVLCLAIFAGSAFAANSIQPGNFGVSVGFNNLSGFPDGLENTIIGKFFLTGDLAAVVGFGFTNSDSDPGVTWDGTDLSLLLGVRKYFKKEDFSPFAEGMLVYMAQDSTGLDTVGILANVGAEYFLHKQFSLEGSVGFGFLNVSTNVGPSADATVMGTQSIGLRANLYFK